MSDSVEGMVDRKISPPSQRETIRSDQTLVSLRKLSTKINQIIQRRFCAENYTVRTPAVYPPYQSSAINYCSYIAAHRQQAVV